MATFKRPLASYPLGGDVMQRFWTAFFSPFGNQVGLINIDLGRSSAPEVEEQVLAEVGSYGRQLGRMGDALAVLIGRLPKSELTPEEAKAIRAFEAMLEAIADIKQDHARPAFRP